MVIFLLDDSLYLLFLCQDSSVSFIFIFCGLVYTCSLKRFYDGLVATLAPISLALPSWCLLCIFIQFGMFLVLSMTDDFS